MNYWYLALYFGLYIGILIWTKVATYIDVKWYKSPERRSKVSVDIPEDADDKTLEKFFNNQNLYEWGLFLGGLMVGGLLIYMTLAW